MSSIVLTHYEVLNDLLLLQWDDNNEDALSLIKMRDNCPCATCAGETDVFGNVYKGKPLSLNKTSYKIAGIQPVGYYAIRPFWEDNHNTGIYSYEFLKKLCQDMSSSSK